MVNLRVSLVAAAPVLMALGLSGCLPDLGPRPPATDAAPSCTGGEMSFTIRNQNYRFEPGTWEVPPGTLVHVTFENLDADVHEASAVDPSLGFPQQRVPGNQTSTFDWRLPCTPGTYVIRCNIHASMRMSVTVR